MPDNPWIEVATAVADDLAADAVERDAANEAPHAEVHKLRASGLLPLLVPEELGGIGASWHTAYAVVREVTRADASIGHLLAYHYLNSWRIHLVDNDDAIARLERETATHQWFWGGAGNPRDASLVLTPDGAGMRVGGRKFFATGAQVADMITASGTRSDTGERLAFVVRGQLPEVEHHGDWDNIGQRLSASGSVSFHDAPVPAADVLGPSEQTGADYRPYASLSPIAFQLTLCQLHIGIAEGALAAAAQYTSSATRPWALADVDSATRDPYILATYGELVAQVRAAAALTDAATAEMVWAYDTRWDLTAEQRGAVAVTVSAAKVASTRAVLDATAKIFELTGARATAAKAGMDRYWRNARTITLHDPVAYKAREVGDHYLNGTLPEPTGYS